METNNRKQLVTQDNGNIEKIFPKNYMSNIVDEETGESLRIFLLKYNHIDLGYRSSKSSARLAVPIIMRRKGLYITYYLPDDIVITEFFNGNKTEVSDTNWVKDELWVKDVNELNVYDVKISDGSITLDKLSEEVMQLISSKGDITINNFPDNEDLELYTIYQDSNNKIDAIRFKDRNNSNGMAYKYLRKTKNMILSQSDFNKANTIYEIRYDFDLNGNTISIPDNCELKFVGGSLKNGTINGNIINDYIKPEWFSAKGDGYTDDTKAIQTIINLNPKKIVFPNNKTFLVSNLYISNSLKIEGNGSTLLFNTDCYTTINYHINISSNVSNIEWTSSSPRISKIYISNTSDYKKGDIIKIYSDDIIEGTEFKQSQYFIVGNIYSNYIEVTGKVIFNFTTNVKIQLIDSSKKIEVNNLVLSSLKHTYYNDRGLFTIIGGAYHNIKDCSIKNTNSHGFLFAGSYGYNVENLELDYQEFINTVPQSIGMGVCDSASSNFTISFKGGYTQAFTCVYFSEIDYPETYGVSQFGNIKNSVATGSALDNHANCYNLVYSDSIISSSENGIVIRGEKCIYDNISVNAAIYGLYVYADSHNTGNSIDFLVRNTNIYSHTRCVQIENNKEFKIKGVIENCVLEGRTAAIYLKNADILFRNCTITGLITISNNVNVIFDNCTLNGYINIAEGIIDSNVIIRNSIINANNHLSFRACPTIIENTTINVTGNYYILVTLATDIVFSKVTFYTSYQYLLRTQNSARVELNDCIINHIGTNEEFHVFRTIGITIDVVLKAIFNNISIYNKALQSTIVYLSYIDSWKGGSSINNRVKSVYVDNSLLDGVYICNRTDRIMVINDIIDNPYYIERGNINTDGTLKDKEVIVYRVEDIVPGLTDTIYKIVKDIDLNGTSKGIPANCTLDFQGGSFSNGTIVFQNTKIIADKDTQIFNNISFSNLYEISIKWFGAKGDGVTDDTNVFLAICNKEYTRENQLTINIPAGVYVISQPINPNAFSDENYTFQNWIGEGTKISPDRVYDKIKSSKTRTVLYYTGNSDLAFINAVNSISNITIRGKDNGNAVGQYTLYPEYDNTIGINISVEDQNSYASQRVLNDVQILFFGIGIKQGPSFSITMNDVSIQRNGFGYIIDTTPNISGMYITYMKINNIFISTSKYTGLKISSTLSNKIIFDGFVIQKSNGTNLEGYYDLDVSSGGASSIEFLSGYMENAGSIRDKVTANINSVISMKDTVLHRGTYKFKGGVIENSQSTDAVLDLQNTSITLNNIRAYDIQNYGNYDSNGYVLVTAKGGNINNNKIINSGTTGIDFYKTLFEGIEITPLIYNPLTHQFWFRAGDDEITFPGNLFGDSDNRPTFHRIGTMYFDTTLNKYICWNGTKWINIDGTALT